MSLELLTIQRTEPLFGWRAGKLSDFFLLRRGVDITEKQAQTGNIPVYSSSGISYYHSQAISEGPGVITGRKGSIGSVFYVDGPFWPHDTTLWVTDFCGNSPEYVWRFLEACSLERFDEASSVPTLNRNNILNRYCVFPPYAEQRKIVEILRIWDDAVAKLEALRAAKELVRSALANDLIFGTRRLPGYSFGWVQAKLVDVTRELNNRNHNGSIGREWVMGVTNTRGIVPMREQTVAEDIARYLILPPRAFAYNPMRINVGSIAMSRFEHGVLVSPDYVLFECLPGKLDPDFLDHLRQSHFWSHYINAGGTGSVRMRTYYDDLAALRLKMPPYEEQLAISEVLNTANRELRLIAQQIEALTRQKRGLMQKLLTGEWRVSASG